MSAEQIDAEKLERIIDATGQRNMVTGPTILRGQGQWINVSCDELDALRAAARAHLSTLPRVKEVPVELWIVVDEEGRPRGYTCESEETAQIIAGRNSCLFAVRLTGTAKVRA